MDKTNHIFYDDGTVKAEIVLRPPASTGDGIRRESLMYSKISKDPVLNSAQALYATLVSGSDIEVLERNGQLVALSVDTVMELPGALTSLWELRIFEINPHWQYGVTPDQLENLQKKASKPSTGSDNFIEQPTKAKSKT
jgi:hypothetical protein